MSFFRTRARPVVRALVVCTSACSLVVGCTQLASAATSPSSELAAAMAAGRAQASVRWVAETKVGAARISEVTVAGKTTGTQEITFSSGSSTGKATAILDGSNVYVNGDAIVLAGFMGFKSSAATAEAGRWIAIPSSTPDYAAVASGLTVASVMAQLALAVPVKSEPSSKFDGTNAIVLTGKTVPSSTAPATPETLYVAASGKPLPLGVTQSTGSGSASIKLSGWDSRVSVSMPKGAVAFSASWLS